MIAREEISADAFVKERILGIQIMLTIASMQNHASVLMIGCTFLIVHENAVTEVNLKGAMVAQFFWKVGNG